MPAGRAELTQNPVFRELRFDRAGVRTADSLEEHFGRSSCFNHGCIGDLRACRRRALYLGIDAESRRRHGRFLVSNVAACGCGTSHFFRRLLLGFPPRHSVNSPDPGGGGRPSYRKCTPFFMHRLANTTCARSARSYAADVSYESTSSVRPPRARR
jgi:hypothetical protein